MSKARVKWIEETTYLGIDANGRSTVISASSNGPGVSPMQMLLLGLGGCTMYDVVNILQKQRQSLTNVEIEIDGQRGGEGARPWQTIHLHYIVSGSDLDPTKVERAIDLSVEKYCGAHATLSGVATITHDFEIRKEE
ncbi:MAG: OsmC family protein [Caldilineaceae bacterium]|nr:OsmC family protein [Caldilineaceae bacterium]